MTEIRFHGRFGQPVGKLVRSIGQELRKRGKHVQIFDAFAAVRPGAPMHSVLRVGDGPILQRSANNTGPDIVVVLDNSLFGVANVIRGLKLNGTVMALGVEAAVLGEKAGLYRFVPLEQYFDPQETLETNLVNALQERIS